MVVDDYGHHPVEIKATLAAARSGWNRRVVAVFQPHRYSRTEALFDDFTKAFYQADHIVVMDVYAAGEEPRPGVCAEKLAEGISGHGHKSCCYTGDAEATVEHLRAVLQAGDIVITLGAGNVWQVGETLLELLREKA
jgi:UDP-N-acetylmuramate--alanine ligase